MTEEGTAGIEDEITRLYREEGGRLLATLIRLLRDFELAEEALQEAFAAAVELWPAVGVPRAPRAWLVSTARHKAIDHLRRRATFARKQEELARELAELGADTFDTESDDEFPDERLRLIFTCCHPAIADDARVPLTLRTLCGLTTEEIARAFLVPTSAMAQRLVRAQRKIRDARIPYRVPPASELPERLEAVLRVIYLVFNEGYATTAGESLTRRDLCLEAVRLGRMVMRLLPGRADAMGLLALMLLHDARREARTGPGGDVVLLEDQDRSLWDRGKIQEGLALVNRALAERTSSLPDPFSVQAAIAGVHAQAARAEDTDWRQIAALYGVLLHVQPTPIVELNRAVAVAMSDGPEHGLRILDALGARGALKGYHLLPAARAALLVTLGRLDEAEDAWRAALRLVQNVAERRFLERRLQETLAASRGD
jgi:RNA polymerase sigma-70 factor, ECF subfamily